VNAVIIPQNWEAIPFFGASPLRRYCPPIPRNDDRIHRYILLRTIVFPQSTNPDFAVSLDQLKINFRLKIKNQLNHHLFKKKPNLTLKNIQNLFELEFLDL
jgi:hypothetical protein